MNKTQMIKLSIMLIFAPCSLASAKYPFVRPERTTLVFVLSNRSFKDYTFNISTGLDNKVFKGYRYTPDNAGDGFMGIGVGTIKCGTVKVKVPDLAWEFWVQQ